MESILIADREVRLIKFYDFEDQVDNKENKQHKRRETTHDPIANVEPSFSQCKTCQCRSFHPLNALKPAHEIPNIQNSCVNFNTKDVLTR
jgi:hypothetical protein